MRKKLSKITGAKLRKLKVISKKVYMQKLDSIVNQYLEMDTNYALMVTGKWGIGKTYYFKNNLLKTIKNKELFTNNSKRYKPLLISLFGLKSIEEVQSEIFLSLYPILKEKRFKLSAAIGKAIFKGILHLKGAGEYSNLVDEINVKKETLLNFEEMVLCFDDLERLSTNFNLEELIGYLNTLVENNNAKIIVIANEDKIEIDNYYVLKEKVVGNSVEFIPDFEKSFDDLISSKFAGFKVYSIFLSDNKKNILDFFVEHSQNFRTLLFTLNYFQKIFSLFEAGMIKSKILNQSKNEILQKLLKFCLTISTEYKNGQITYTNRNDLDSNVMSDMDMIRLENIIGRENNSQDLNVSMSFKDTFLTKYYLGDKFLFFESIYEYLTGGDTLNLNKLTDELNQLYHLQGDIIQPHYELYKKLNYPVVYNLTDKEYIDLTKDLLKNAEKGVYDLIDYLSIYYFITRFGNPLKFNLEKLRNRIFKGIDKGRSHYEYVHDLEFYLKINNENENIEYLLELKKYILEVNEQILEQEKRLDYSRLENLYYENFDVFFTEMLTREKTYFHTPVLSTFNVTQFYNFFDKSNNIQKLEILKFWRSRYNDTLTNYLVSEISFLRDLLRMVENKNTKNKKNVITNQMFFDLSKILRNNIKKLELHING